MANVNAAAVAVVVVLVSVVVVDGVVGEPQADAANPTASAAQAARHPSAVVNVIDRRLPVLDRRWRIGHHEQANHRAR
jgi:hypothetical protein